MTDAAKLTCQASRGWEEVQHARSLAAKRMKSLDEDLSSFNAGRGCELPSRESEERKQEMEELRWKEIEIRRQTRKEEAETEGLSRRQTEDDDELYLIKRGFVEEKYKKPSVEEEMKQKVREARAVKEIENAIANKQKSVSASESVKADRTNWFHERINSSQDNCKCKVQLEELQERQRQADEEEKRLKKLAAEKSRVYEKLYQVACLEQSQGLKDKAMSLAGGKRDLAMQKQLHSDVVNKDIEQDNAVHDCLVTKATPSECLVRESNAVCNFVPCALTKPDVKAGEVAALRRLQIEKCRKGLRYAGELNCNKYNRVELYKQIETGIMRFNKHLMRQVVDSKMIGFDSDNQQESIATTVDSFSGLESTTSAETDFGADDGCFQSEMEGEDVKSLNKKTVSNELQVMLDATWETIRLLGEVIENNRNKQTESQAMGIGNGVQVAMKFEDNSKAACQKVNNYFQRGNYLHPLKRCKSDLGLNRRVSKLLEAGNFCEAKRRKVKMRDATEDNCHLVKNGLERNESGIKERETETIEVNFCKTPHNFESFTTISEENVKGNLDAKSWWIDKEEIKEYFIKMYSVSDYNESRGSVFSDQALKEKLEAISDGQRSLKRHIDECFLKREVGNLRKTAIMSNKKLGKKPTKLSISPVKFVVVERNQDKQTNKVRVNYFIEHQSGIVTQRACQNSCQRNDHQDIPTISKLPDFQPHRREVMKEMRRPRFYCRLNKRFLNYPEEVPFKRKHPPSIDLDAIHSDSRALAKAPNIVNSIKEAPKVLNSFKDAPNVINSFKEAPNVVNSVEESPNVIKSIEEAPNVINSIKEAPNVINSIKEAPNVINSIKEAPNVIKTVAETPNVVNSAAEASNVGNSATQNVAKIVAESPNKVAAEHLIVIETKIDVLPLQKIKQEDILSLDKMSERQSVNFCKAKYEQVVRELKRRHTIMNSKVDVSNLTDVISNHGDVGSVISNNEARGSKTLPEKTSGRIEIDKKNLELSVKSSALADKLVILEEGKENIDLERKSENDTQIEHEENDVKSLDCKEVENFTANSIKPVNVLIREADERNGPKLRDIFKVDTDEDVIKILCGEEERWKRGCGVFKMAMTGTEEEFS